MPRILLQFRLSPFTPFYSSFFLLLAEILIDNNRFIDYRDAQLYSLLGGE